jgi:hypothetical protein
VRRNAAVLQFVPERMSICRAAVIGSARHVAARDVFSESPIETARPLVRESNDRLRRKALSRAM